MAKYVVESFDWQIFHNGVTSDGVVGQGGSREKIYLHVIELSETESKRLVPRQDEHGNRESDRLTLFNNEEWWIPVDGAKAWPKTVNPKIISSCVMGDDGIARPRALSDADVATLKKLGVPIPD